MKIHRAHDGRTIEVKQPLDQFAGFDDLLDSISLATGISSDGIICMSADGVQLTPDLLSTLATQPSDSSDNVDFFVFNRDYLYADPESVAQELAETPHLSARVEQVELVQPPTPRSLENIINWAHAISESIQEHAATSRRHHAALVTIQRSTSVALLNLLSHADTVKGEAGTIRKSSRSELNRMGTLLQGYQRDLEILGLVGVHPRLVPSASSQSNGSTSAGAGAHSSSSGPQTKRTLGTFVSSVKMGAVADACNRVHKELVTRLEDLEGNADQLDSDTAELQRELVQTGIEPSTETMEDASRSETRAEELSAFLVHTCSPDANGWPVADKLDDTALTGIQQSTSELISLDEAVRECVRRLTADKNDIMAHSLTLLGDISGLQSDYADLAAGLASFDSDLHSNRVDGFKHLARLSNMLWAYGATVVEVVRRREFSKHFLAKSQALAEVMARVSARERKRRGKYRSDVAAQLPWEVSGMDEAPPSLEISTKAHGSGPDLDRKEIEALLQLIEEIESTLAQADQISGDTASGGHLVQVKDALRELVLRMDSMDEEFAAMLEEDLLGVDNEDEGDEGDDQDESSQSSSLAAIQRRIRRKARISTFDAEASRGQLVNERKEKERLQQEVQQLRLQSDAQEKANLQQHQAELHALRTESSTTRAEARRIREQLDQERHDAAADRAQLEALRGDVETERERRLNMQEELSILRKEALTSRKEEEQAKREAAEDAERFAELEIHLHDVQAELEAAKAARADASHRIESLLSEGSNVEKELSAAQERIEDLSQQLEQARQEAREARDAHAEAEAARERSVRSYRAEADSDRAILEENLRETTLQLETVRHELNVVKESTKVESDTVQTLRSQLRGADEAHEELVKMMETAKDSCAEADFAKRHAERENEQLLEAARPLVESLLDLQSHLKTLPTLSSSRTPSTAVPVPTPAEEKNLTLEGANGEHRLDEEAVDEAGRVALAELTSSDTRVDIDTAILALRALNPREECEQVKKRLDMLVTLVRKWQKTYKRHTSEAATKLASAARDRIAFRNFQIGDLALFLPSRNNVLDPKPWAAFNISFPHFFLNAPAASPLAEQLRTKEWIVARIVHIVERVTDSSTPDGNPFQLAEGVRFCLLNVEGWDPQAPTGAILRPSKGRQVSGMSISKAENPSKELLHSVNGAPDHPKGPQDALPAQTSLSSISTPTAIKESTMAESPSAVIDPVTPPKSKGTVTSAPAVVASEPTTSMPSGLTRAMRAAGSRSPSQTRGGLRNHGNFLDAQPDNAAASLAGPSSVARSAASVGPNMEGNSSGVTPAFGIRGRRKGGRGSTATSPTAAATSRLSDLGFEAMSNPFSASPGGIGSTLSRTPSTQQSPIAALAEQNRRRPLTQREFSSSSTAAEPIGEEAAPLDRASGNFSSRRSPSMLSFQGRSTTIGPGNSPGPAIALPVEPSASLALAQGETSSSHRGSLGDDAVPSHQSAGSGSGFSSTGPSSLLTRPSLSSRTTAPSGNVRSAYVPPRSPSFFSRTFGRKAGSRDSVVGLFGPTGSKLTGADEETNPDAGITSASAILKRLNDQR